jgi:hypothetical protein
MAVDKDEVFERMARAQERLADAIEKQQPGRFERMMSVGAAIAGSMSLVIVAETIKNWINGG